MYMCRGTALYFLLVFVEITSTRLTKYADADRGSREVELLKESEEREEMPAEGRGYELEGIIKGHCGLFQKFNWTMSELRRVSECHATAEYYKVVEMVEEKLDTTKLSLKDRREIIEFIDKHRPPQLMAHLYTENQKEQIKAHRRKGEMKEIYAIYSSRFETLRSEIFRQIMDYMNPPNKPT